MKNQTDILSLINKIQEQLIALDRKVDTLIHRSLPETKLASKLPVHSAPLPVNPNERNNARVLHKVICADCNKECTIPFKPSGDRPVYCKDCFSRRKVIRLSGMNVNDKPQETASAQIPAIKEIDIPKSQAKTKKKTATVKKPVTKKKPAPKKNKKK